NYPHLTDVVFDISPTWSSTSHRRGLRHLTDVVFDISPTWSSTLHRPGLRHLHRRGLRHLHGRGLIASRSDEPTVAVGFIPRFGASDALRRGATPDSGAAFSIVAARRRISWRIKPWLES